MYNILVNYTCSLYRLAARRKIQALLGRQPNSEYNQICFLFPYFFLFSFFLYCFYFRICFRKCLLSMLTYFIACF
ncbi:hypothetical protein RchiOBHm_Chr2g0122761 [Rosa chinensis]|uniref:Uncharacterized protein n=1 Tax=Rosa chinensis TaxID=74649 RepID=A0A2P6RSV7_ROSCH|nr:hypothetical protein RchiOBHm_Chr2g0122761 [Rosa chinensis]